jgi:iron complex outermembrane recepter protein
MRKLFVLAIFFHLGLVLHAQEISRDSTLSEIIVQAYTADRPPEQVPASIGYLRTEDLSRFNNTSLVPVVNTIPGVRMEERSPGSYRFSIRGSSIRSPFGVRNVKVYWNGLPLTDAGGNTYLNLLDISQMGSIEIIKGPGGSLYGAGTGGVILLNTPRVSENLVYASASIGGFGLQRYSAGGKIHSRNVNLNTNLSLQKSEGYRDQSAMDRKAFNLDLKFPVSEKAALSAAIFYTDLFYETPGGLNEAQFEDDPSAARPPVSTPTTNIPGAEQQKAAVFNKTVYVGITHEQEWSSRWSTATGFYGAYVDFKNPNIRNYEIRKEPNAGVRTVTKFQSGKGAYKNVSSFGGEFQYLDGGIDIYGNDGGTKGQVVSLDKLTSKLFTLFAQHDVLYNERFNLTAGLSLNFLHVKFERTEPEIVAQKRDFKPVVSPRIAIMEKISRGLSVYASYSRGFSPPTKDELYPSRQIFDKDLQPESGNNFEAGFKGNAGRRKLLYELAAYHFGLNNTIVIRRDASIPGEPDYFVNAGKTEQRGVEAIVTWIPIAGQDQFISDLKLTSSYSYNHYRFKDYTIRSTEFSGNKFTGVPPTVAFFGVDVKALEKFYLNLSSNYVDHIPLDDANTTFSKPYVLINLRAGYTQMIGNAKMELFGGVENLTDEIYSLGHDLNGPGGRYYNAALPRNFFAGVRFDLSIEP